MQRGLKMSYLKSNKQVYNLSSVKKTLNLIKYRIVIYNKYQTFKEY